MARRNSLDGYLDKEVVPCVLYHVVRNVGLVAKLDSVVVERIVVINGFVNFWNGYKNDNFLEKYMYLSIGLILDEMAKWINNKGAKFHVLAFNSMRSCRTLFSTFPLCPEGQI